MIFKKAIRILSVSALVFALLSAYVFAASVYKNGTFEGSGQGKRSTVVLNVTVNDDKIKAIDIVSQNETPYYWKRAVVLIDKIIEKNSTDVDCITGATKSSNAIKTAVDNALDSAKNKSVKDYISEHLQTVISQLINIFKQLFSFLPSC